MRYTIKEASQELGISETTVNSFISKLDLKVKYKPIKINVKSSIGVRHQKIVNCKYLTDIQFCRIKFAINLNNKIKESYRIEKITIGLKEKYNKNKNHAKKYMDSKHFDFFSTNFMN
jgi:DNA-binding MurR/RpiR family transcriptional regulator